MQPDFVRRRHHGALSAFRLGVICAPAVLLLLIGSMLPVLRQQRLGPAALAMGWSAPRNEATSRQLHGKALSTCLELMCRKEMHDCRVWSLEGDAPSTCNQLLAQLKATEADLTSSRPDGVTNSEIDEMVAEWNVAPDASGVREFMALKACYYGGDVQSCMAARANPATLLPHARRFEQSLYRVWRKSQEFVKALEAALRRETLPGGRASRSRGRGRGRESAATAEATTTTARNPLGTSPSTLGKAAARSAAEQRQLRQRCGAFLARESCDAGTVWVAEVPCPELNKAVSCCCELHWDSGRCITGLPQRCLSRDDSKDALLMTTGQMSGGAAGEDGSSTPGRTLSCLEAQHEALKVRGNGLGLGAPVPPPPPMKKRPAFSPTDRAENKAAVAAVFVPQCATDGAYELMQCDQQPGAANGGGECWCVDSTGAEYPNSRVPKMKGPPSCERIAAAAVCAASRFGCCPDGVSPAKGPGGLGCDEPICQGPCFPGDMTHQCPDQYRCLPRGPVTQCCKYPADEQIARRRR